LRPNSRYHPAFGAFGSNHLQPCLMFKPKQKRQDCLSTGVCFLGSNFFVACLSLSSRIVTSVHLSIVLWLSFVRESSFCFPDDYRVVNFGKTAVPAHFANLCLGKQALIRCLKMCFGDIAGPSSLASSSPCYLDEPKIQRR